MEAQEFEANFAKGAIRLCSQCPKGLKGVHYDMNRDDEPWIPQCLETRFSRILRKQPEECLLKLELATCGKDFVKYLKRHCKPSGYIAFTHRQAGDRVNVAHIIASNKGRMIGWRLRKRNMDSKTPGKTWYCNSSEPERFNDDSIKIVAKGDLETVSAAWRKANYKRRMKSAQEAVEAAKEDLRLAKKNLAETKADKPK